VLDLTAEAGVAEPLVAAGVLDRHPAAAPATQDQASQQGGASPDRPARAGERPIIGDPPLIGLIALPGDVGGGGGRQPGPTPLGRYRVAPGSGSVRALPAGIDRATAVAVGPGIDRVVQHVQEGRPTGSTPLQPPPVRPAVRPDPQADLVPRQVLQELVDGA